MAVLHPKVATVYSDRPYGLVRCVNCRHVITSPKPDANELQRLYSREYAYGAHLLIEGEKRFRAKWLAGVLKHELRGSASQRVLEIGCMYGFLLQALKGQGMQAAGIDLDEAAVAYCRASGLNATVSSIEAYGGGEGCDCVAMAHVFEHLLEPEGALRKLEPILNRGGVLCLAVPNSHSRLARFLSRHWGWWQVPVHINHFTAESLKRMLEKNGYKVTRTLYRGGDSLMLLLCAANAAGVTPSGRDLGWFQTKVISLASRVLRYWYFAGDDELVMVARRS